jgi:hypothetical protein
MPVSSWKSLKPVIIIIIIIIIINFIIIIIIIIIIFNLLTASFKAYCVIWVKRSNFRHQESPRVSPRESTQRRRVELWERNVRKFCLNADLLHAVKLRRHGTDGFTSPPKEGVLRIFFALKIRRLRPGANPRTWVPKVSTLPLDHRSRYVVTKTSNCLLECDAVQPGRYPPTSSSSL